MTRVKVGILLAVIVAAAVLVFQASSVMRREAIRSDTGGPAATDAGRAMTAEEAQRAEQELLADRSFARQVSAPAPDVALVTSKGERVTLSSRRGKVLFVNFWATWCPPCTQEMPGMVRLGAELAAAHPDRFEMLAVSEDDSWEAVHQYFDKSFGGPPKALTLVRDPDSSAARAFYCGARGYCPDLKFPETYIVDRAGRIVSMVVGPRDWSEPAARQWLESLIRG